MMKKIIALFVVVVALFSMSMPTAMAGSVNGKITKIRAYEQGNQVRFESRIPNVDIVVRKVDIIKGMLKRGKTTAIVNIERDGILIDVDKKVLATLDRVGDGLYIKTRNVDMFVSEKELDRVKKLR